MRMGVYYKYSVVYVVYYSVVLYIIMYVLKMEQRCGFVNIHSDSIIKSNEFRVNIQSVVSWKNPNRY